MLWVVKGLGRGGAEQLLVAHARRADHDRFDYHVAWVTPGKGDLAEDLAAAGVTLHDLSGAGAWPVRLHRLVDELEPDVVHSHSPLPAVVTRVGRWLGRRVPLVYTEHNRWPMYRLPTKWANAATHAVDDHQFAVSQDVVDSVAPARQPSLGVLHHGIDVAGLADTDGAAVRTELGLDPDRLLVVTVANCRPEKDLQVLVEAASIVRNRRDDVVFAHAGSGPTEADLDRAIAATALGDGFRRLGKRDDAVDLIAAADVFCLSSRHEGLPVTVMESLAVGTPVVATDVGGIGEAARDGIEAQLVPAGDPRALAQALMDVLEDDERRRQMAAAARERAAAFDAGRATAVVEATYDRLVGRTTDGLLEEAP